MQVIRDQYIVCRLQEERPDTSNSPSVNQKETAFSEEGLFYFCFIFILALPTFDPGFEHRFHYWVLNLSGCCALLFSPAVTASQLCSLTFLQKISSREIPPKSRRTAALLFLILASGILHLIRIHPVLSYSLVFHLYREMQPRCLHEPLRFGEERWTSNLVEREARKMQWCWIPTSFTVSGSW